MRYLLDTHTLIWFCENDKQLSNKVSKEIINTDNDCYLSIASLWEIAIKFTIGKLDIETSFNELTKFLSDNKITVLPVEINDLQILLSLELIHRDPFDRIIIAQGIAQNLTILTKDENFRNYPVKSLW